MLCPCANCDKLVKRSPSQVGEGAVYCSRKCMSEHRATPCPFTSEELREMYITQEQPPSFIAKTANELPCTVQITDKIVQNWLKRAAIAQRTRKEDNAIKAKLHSAENAIKAREVLERMREEGFVTSDASQMHTPERWAKAAKTRRERRLR
jgi:hypothetical protein